METLMYQRGPPLQMLSTPGPEVKQQVPAVASPDDDEVCRFDGYLNSTKAV